MSYTNTNPEYNSYTIFRPEYSIPILLNILLAYTFFSPSISAVSPLKSNICIEDGCNMKLALKKCNLTDDWSIHGLWLDYKNGSYPEYCRNMSYSNIMNTSLENTMNNKWYSCEGTNYNFWNHELQKHGSCIKDYLIPSLNSTKYFNDTINIYNGMSSIIPYHCNNKNKQCFITLT